MAHRYGCSSSRGGLSPSQLLCFVLLAAVLLVVISEKVEVLNFQPDGLPRRDTEALYKGEVSRDNQLSSLTLCFRFRLHYLHASATVFKLLDTPTGQDEMLIGILWVDRIRTMIAGLRKFQPLKREFRTNRWHHVCFIYDDEKKEIGSYVDSKLNYWEPYDIGPKAYGDTVWIGQGAKVSVDENSFSGEITQVNVWDYALTEEEVIDMATCKTNPQGNFVAWDKGWTLFNIESRQEDLSAICQLDGQASTYQWFPKVSQLDSNYICSALGGSLPEITDLEGAQMYHAMAKRTWPNQTSCQTKFWTPLSDFIIEGDWRRGFAPSQKGDLFWAGGEPDGIFYQNCALIYPEGMRDVNCPVINTCAVCELKSSIVFSLRGTCETDKRHVYFTSFQTELGKLEFRGYGGYHIQLEDGEWVWRKRIGSDIIATMEIAEPNYPLGRHNWFLKASMCSEDSPSRILLFTPCNEDQFTCDDAKCVSLSYRCDLKYDCLDHSDEVDCELVNRPAGYQFDLPPRPISTGETFLPIATNVTIKSIGVDTMSMNMFVSYEIQMTWFDNRVKFLNLKKRRTLNVLPFAIIKQLWTPAIAFTNTEGGHTTIVDIKAMMFVTRLMNSTSRDLSTPAEVEIYDGADNYITLSRQYATLYKCDFNLILYPFDDQYCDMLLQVMSGSRDYLRFDIDRSIVTYLGNPLLLEYAMRKVELKLGSNWEYSQLIVRVPLERRIGYAILNIYTPSMILLVISYVTLYFQPHIFDVRVMSVLTVLLVTATLFTQVSSSLPKTAYFKMVDIWLLFCIVMNFLIINVHAVVDYAYHVEQAYKRAHPKNVVQPLTPEPIMEPLTKTMHQTRIHVHMKAMEEQRVYWPDDDGPDNLFLNVTVKTLVEISKGIVMSVFLIFSVCYWGYILF